MSLAYKLWRRAGVVGFIAILSNFLLLQGCIGATSRQGGKSDQDLEAFCAQNHFVQKYTCSLDQIQASAMQGDPDAEYALGYLYYYGIGTQADENTALIWMNKAAAQGQPIAIRAIKILQTAQFPELGSVKVSSSHSASIPLNRSQAGRSSVGKLHRKSQRAVQQNDYKSRQPIGDFKRHTKVAPANKSTPVRVALATTKKVTSAVQTSNGQKWARCNAGNIARLPASLDSLNLSSRQQLCTLQLTAGHSLAGVQTFVNASSLSGVKIYKTHLKGRAWYIAAYGLFANSRAALAARACLQRVGGADLRKAYAKAWPKPLRSVQMAARSMSSKKLST